MSRPFVLASVAVSLDGCIDDAGPTRLLLSGPEDLDRVDEVRAGVDAILVGAGTVRSDDPRLEVRSAVRRAASGTPLKVVLSAGGPLDPAARVFTGGPTVVYCTGAPPAVPAELVPVPDLAAALTDLARRGVRRLLVEGGTSVHTQFLAAGLVDELHVAVAPILVGDPDAPRFVRSGVFPPGRMELLDARPAGDVVLLRYRP